MEEKDIFRDSPLRYMGYANELGESFRSVVDVKYVNASYVVASSYVLADTISKSLKTWRANRNLSTGHRVSKTASTSIDVLLWQSFASVIIPGFTINRICAASRFLLAKSKMFNTRQVKWITVGVGLASIPLIIHPIDHGVDYAMDRTIRPLIGTDKKTASN